MTQSGRKQDDDESVDVEAEENCGLQSVTSNCGYLSQVTMKGLCWCLQTASLLGTVAFFALANSQDVPATVEVEDRPRSQQCDNQRSVNTDLDPDIFIERQSRY